MYGVCVLAVMTAGMLAGVVAPAYGDDVNGLPVIDAGPDQYVLVGEVGTIHATAFDPDGDPLTYIWSVGNMAVGPGAIPFFAPDAVRHILSFGNLTLSNVTALSPNFTAPAHPHTFTLMLTASDGLIHCFDTVMVEVVDELPSIMPTVGDPEPSDRGSICYTFYYYDEFTDSFPDYLCIVPEPPSMASIFAPKLDHIPEVVMRHDDRNRIFDVSVTTAFNEYDYFTPPLGGDRAWYSLRIYDPASYRYIPPPDFVTIDGDRVVVAPGPDDVGTYKVQVVAQSVFEPVDWFFQNAEPGLYPLCQFTHAPVTGDWREFTVTILPSASYPELDHIPDLAMSHDDPDHMFIPWSGIDFDGGFVVYDLLFAPDFVSMTGSVFDSSWPPERKTVTASGYHPMLVGLVTIAPGPDDVGVYTVTIQGEHMNVDDLEPGLLPFCSDLDCLGLRATGRNTMSFWVTVHP